MGMRFQFIGRVGKDMVPGVLQLWHQLQGIATVEGTVAEGDRAELGALTGISTRPIRGLFHGVRGVQAGLGHR